MKKYSLPLENREIALIWNHFQCWPGTLEPTRDSVPIKIRNLKKIAKESGIKGSMVCAGTDAGDA